MSAKQFTLYCNHAQRRLLSRAIRHYVEAAYPPGGSECAQAARETMLNAALHCDSVAEMEIQVMFSRRIRSYLRAAIQYFVEQQQNQAAVAEAQALLEALS